VEYLYSSQLFVIDNDRLRPKLHSDLFGLVVNLAVQQAASRNKSSTNLSKWSLDLNVVGARKTHQRVLVLPESLEFQQRRGVRADQTVLKARVVQVLLLVLECQESHLVRSSRTDLAVQRNQEYL